MGILNVTPDSFYERVGGVEDALARARAIVAAGAAVIDVGGQSYAHWNPRIAAEEERRARRSRRRAIVADGLDVAISIDTFKAGGRRRRARGRRAPDQRLSGLSDPALAGGRREARRGPGRDAPQGRAERARPGRYVYRDAMREIVEVLRERTRRARAAGVRARARSRSTRARVRQGAGAPISRSSTASASCARSAIRFSSPARARASSAASSAGPRRSCSCRRWRPPRPGSRRGRGCCASTTSPRPCSSRGCSPRSPPSGAATLESRRGCPVRRRRQLGTVGGGLRTDACTRSSRARLQPRRPAEQHLRRSSGCARVPHRRRLVVL